MTIPNTSLLSTYYRLGRTGLRVSPVALGGMTFGAQAWGDHDWGADEDTSRAVFLRYLEAGGNFVDTANNYTGGRSEELVGRFLRETGARERVVLATKFTSPDDPTDPNAAGNGRKNIMRSLDGSLRRLGTDFVDLYWLHMWDTTTPVEEVMATFDALVRSGKVRAVGLSDVPAWYVVKAQTLADRRGWEPVAALQLEYSLVERNIEREHVPAALDLGIGLVPWSPLAGGFLTGKYSRDAEGLTGDGRLQAFRGAPAMPGPTEQAWDVLEALRGVAKEVERTPAQVALNWLTRQPGVTAPVVGARTPEQLDENLDAFTFELTGDQLDGLEQAGRPELVHPYRFFDRTLLRVQGLPYEVRGTPSWHRR